MRVERPLQWVRAGSSKGPGAYAPLKFPKKSYVLFSINFKDKKEKRKFLYIVRDFKKSK